MYVLYQLKARCSIDRSDLSKSLQSCTVIGIQYQIRRLYLRRFKASWCQDSMHFSNTSSFYSRYKDTSHNFLPRHDIYFSFNSLNYYVKFQYLKVGTFISNIIFILGQALVKVLSVAPDHLSAYFLNIHFVHLTFSVISIISICSCNYDRSAGHSKMI